MAAFRGDSIFWIETSKIVPNPYQPRREFDEARLKELSESIRMYGVLQPLTVSRREVHDEDGAFKTEYELIAGERRLRASRLAGLEQVPVIIREGDESEQEKLELAIIENLQREDLNAVDRALAFRQLADVFGLSHSDVAKKVGRSREYVSNSIRLLGLPDYMLDSLKISDISEGHARTLLMLNDRPEEQDTLYREILLKKLTVREVERIARKIATDKVRTKVWKGSDPELIEKERVFTETLGTRVQLTKTDYGGKITIDYFSDEDLDTLLERLAAQKLARAEAASQAFAAEEEAYAKLSDATPLRAVVAATTTWEGMTDTAKTVVPANTDDEIVSLNTDERPEDFAFEAPAPETPEPDVVAMIEESVVPDEPLDNEPVSEAEPAVANPEEPTSSEVESEPQVAETSTPAPKTGSSLRDKLARIFGEQAAPAAAASAVVASVSEASFKVTETQPAVAPEETEVTIPRAEEPSTPVAPKPEETEDDIYNLKNFSI